MRRLRRERSEGRSTPTSAVIVEAWLELRRVVVYGTIIIVLPLLPVFFMTALATGLALVPLVISGEIPGAEIEYPMAIVILGGLITSTLLNLFVVPTLYLRFGRARGT